MKRAAPWLWVAGIVSLVYLPLFYGQIIFYRDAAHWNYPARFFVRDALLRGDFPSWNPLQGLGFSIFANPLYGLFYPPHWLFLLTPTDFVASMTTWQGFAHVVWGSLGVLALARQLGLSGMAAGVAGLAWGLSGHTTAGWTAGLLLHAGSWVPWCGVGFVAFIRRYRAGMDGWLAGVALAALPVAMAMLFGEIFLAMMGVIFGLAVVGAALVVERRADSPPPAIRPRRLLAGLGVALALAAGIGAIVVIPARLISAANVRGQPLHPVLAEVCSLNPIRLLEMVAPSAMGFAFGNYPAAAYVGEPLLDGLPLMYSVYMGASAVALALVALGRGRRMAACLGFLALAALIIALGRHTPVHGLWRLVMRPFAYMRYPEKYLAIFVPTLALLAGLGAERLLVDRARPWRRLIAFAGTLLVIAIAAPWIFPADWAAYVRRGALIGTGGVLAVLVVCHLAARRSAIAAPLLVLTVGIDLAAAGVPHLGFGPRSVANELPEAARVIWADHRARGATVAPPRSYRANRLEAFTRKFGAPRNEAEGELLSTRTLVPNAVTAHGVASLPGYDAAISAGLQQLWKVGEKHGQAMLRLLGVGYAVLPVGDPRDPVEHRTGFEPMMDPVAGARLYRVPSPLPRLYLVGRASLVEDDHVMARLADPEVVSGSLALLAPADGARALDGPEGRAGECRLLAHSNSRVVAQCRADRAAMAVFVEQHEMGWRAEVDGRAAPLWRANLVMRAVPLDAGTHKVVLTYTPPGVQVAGIISGTSALALVGFGAMVWVVRRRRAVRG